MEKLDFLIQTLQGVEIEAGELKTDSPETTTLLIEAKAEVKRAINKFERLEKIILNEEEEKHEHKGKAVKRQEECC